MKIFSRNKKDKNVARRVPENSSRSVFSYYARGSSGSNQNVGRRDTSSPDTTSTYSFRIGHLPGYFTALVIVIALGYACLLQPSPIIIVVNESNTLHRDPAAYKDAIRATWNKSILNKTKITVNTQNIKTDIELQFPELAGVEIDLPLLGRRPTVILTPQKPALQIVSINGSFYVNATGKVMSRTSDLKKNNITNLPLIRDESGISADPGSPIIPASEATFLSSLYVSMLSEKINVESITLPLNVANEADVRIIGQKYYIKFSINSDPRQAVGTYLAAKEKLTKDGVVPNEYLDVRVDEKVFYK